MSSHVMSSHLHFGQLEMVHARTDQVIIELPGKAMYGIMERSIRWHSTADINAVRQLDYKDILWLRRDHSIDLPPTTPVYFRLK